jgi:hypothetical protein
MRTGVNRMLIALIASAGAGCVGGPSQSGWPRTFDADITRVAGEGVVDCGFFRLDGAGPASERRAARACMAEARNQGRPFKYGTLRVPMDSFAWEVFVHTPGGDFLFVQDEMVLQDFVQRWLQQCAKVEVHRCTGIIVAEQCADLPAAAS